VRVSITVYLLISLVAGDEPIVQPVGMHAEHPLGLLVRGEAGPPAPVLTALALAAAGLDRSPIRTRSNSVRPALIVGISLPLEALKSKLRAVELGR
jgi:hypothetical protein